MKTNPSSVKVSLNGFKSVLGPLFRRGTIGSNSLLSFTSLSAQFFANVVLFMVLARLVDVSTLGEILYATVLANIVTVLASYGFENLVIREISQARYGLGELTANLLLAKIILSITLILLMCLFVEVFPIPLEHPGDLWFYIGAALLNSFIDSIIALRKGKNDFTTGMLVSLFRSGLFFIGVLAVAYLWGATTLLVGQIRLGSRLFSLLFASVVFARASWKAGTDWDRWRIRPIVVQMLFVVGLPFALQAILSTAYFQLDTLVLGALRTSEEVGYYQASAQILTGVMLVPIAVIQAYYPRLAHQFSTLDSKNAPLMKQMMGVLAILGTGLTALFGLGAPFLIRVLYGPKMEPSIFVMQVLSLVFLVRSVAGGFGISLLSIGWQKILAVTGFVALIGSLTLNLLLVPRGGFVAAAWVNLTTNLLVLGIYAFWWPRAQPRFVEVS